MSPPSQGLLAPMRRTPVPGAGEAEGTEVDRGGEAHTWKEGWKKERRERAELEHYTLEHSLTL